jgi:hypothetical protein
MIVEAEVVDRDEECHLLRVGETLVQVQFDPDTVFSVGDLVTLDTEKDNVEVIS